MYLPWLLIFYFNGITVCSYIGISVSVQRCIKIYMFFWKAFSFVNLFLFVLSQSSWFLFYPNSFGYYVHACLFVERPEKEIRHVAP